MQRGCQVKLNWLIMVCIRSILLFLQFLSLPVFAIVKPWFIYHNEHFNDPLNVLLRLLLQWILKISSEFSYRTNFYYLISFSPDWAIYMKTNLFYLPCAFSSIAVSKRQKQIANMVDGWVLHTPDMMRSAVQWVDWMKCFERQ